MAIKGSLREASLPDVLQLLAMGKKTGCLGLAFHENFGSIYFDSGRICHATIANRDVDTENAVYSLFTWANGSFNFEPGVLPQTRVELVSVDPQSLLLEGARRVDEWTLIEKKITSFDAVFALDRQRLLVNKLPLTPEQEILVPLIDGHRDVNALIRDSQLGEFETGKALYGLASASFAIQVGRAKAPDSSPRDASPAERRGLGLALYRAGMYEEAEREFRGVVGQGIADPVASFYVGLIALRRGEWEEAVRAFQTAAPALRQKASVLNNLALAYERMGQLEKARLLAERAVSESGGTDPTSLLQLGIIALALGNLPLARKSLAEARSLWTSTAPPAAWFHYAALTAAAGNDLHREMLLLGAGADAHRDSATLLNNLAVAHLRKGEYRQAREAAERGLAIAPDLVPLSRNLADATNGLNTVGGNAA